MEGKEDDGLGEALMIVHYEEHSSVSHTAVVHWVDLWGLLLVVAEVCGKKLLLLDASRVCLGKGQGLREQPLKSNHKEEVDQ